MIHEHGDIVMVEVKSDAKIFGIVPSLPKDYLFFDDNFGHDGTCEIQLPAIGYTIVGLSSKLSEDEWRGIVETNSEGFEHYMTDEEYDRSDHVYPLPTATESGLSLLKSKNLSPDTTLILKKQNSKI